VTAFVGLSRYASRTVPASSNSLTFAGLKGGLTYAFAIAAANANGTGQAAVTTPTEVRSQ